MCNRTQQGQKWLVGMVNVDGCQVPIVEYGATREEAERQAQQTIAWFWAYRPQLETLDLPDLHNLIPGG